MASDIELRLAALEAELRELRALVGGLPTRLAAQSIGPGAVIGIFAAGDVDELQTGELTVLAEDYVTPTSRKIPGVANIGSKIQQNKRAIADRLWGKWVAVPLQCTN